MIKKSQRKCEECLRRQKKLFICIECNKTQCFECDQREHLKKNESTHLRV